MIYEVPARANEIPGLEDYLRALRQRWRLVIIVTLLVLALAVMFDRSRTLTYDAEAKVVINPTIANAANNSLQKPVLERESEVLGSNAVATQASEELGDVTPAALLRDLDVDFVNQSETLSLTYNSIDPTVAAERVNAIVDSYVELREQASLTVYETQIQALEEELADLAIVVEELSREIGGYQSQRTAAFALPATDPSRQALIDDLGESIQAATAERNQFNSNVATATRELRTIRRQLSSRPVTAEVIQYAEPPESPAGPGRSLILAAGLFLGTIAGVALAFVLDRLDRTAKESADVEAAIGTSVLGNVPKYPFGATRSGLIMLSSARNSRVQRVREAYRRIRASLQFLQTSKEVKSLVITSAHPTEGKSSTVANIAVAAAQAGSKVVVVSADMRRPVLERMFGIDQDRGLSDYLNNPDMTDILIPAPGVDGLVILPSGAPPPNPGELLGSPSFASLLYDLKDQFDLVLIDMPPVLSTADAGSASYHADGVVIVVDGQRTDTDALLRVRTTIERSGGRIVGAVLNKDSSDGGITLRRDRYAYEKVASQA